MVNDILEIVVHFVLDSLWMLFLIFVMVSIVGVLRSYIPTSKIRKWLEKLPFGLSNFIAAIFGTLTPFCSCSSIPIFLSFIRAGVPLGVSFSFLITSPLVNEYLVVLMWAAFGWKIAVAYYVFGVLLGVVFGLILGAMGLEKYVVKDIMPTPDKSDSKDKFTNFMSRVKFGIHEGFDIVKKLWYWILIGVGIGAILHNFVPDTIIQTVVNKTGILAVPIAVIMGVPLYGSCAGIVPIAVALLQKGVPIGTSLALMMAISALSFPEAVILRRAIKLRLILIFFGMVALGIIITGYLFNFLQPFLM